jgi:hypothetical protein
MFGYRVEAGPRSFPKETNLCRESEEGETLFHGTQLYFTPTTKRCSRTIKFFPEEGVSPLFLTALKREFRNKVLP